MSTRRYATDPNEPRYSQWLESQKQALLETIERENAAGGPELEPGEELGERDEDREIGG